MLTRTLPFLAVLLAVATVPRPAEACSRAICTVAFLPTSETVPASLGAFRLLTAFPEPAPTVELLEVLPDGSTLVVDADVVAVEGPATSSWDVVPRDPLVPDTLYRITAEGGGCDSATTEILTTARVDLPTELGALSAGPATMRDLDLETSSGSCTAAAHVNAADVTLMLSPEAEPLADALQYETFVDGELWAGSRQYSLGYIPEPGGSWTGRGSDRVYTLCDDAVFGVYGGLSEGMHEVEVVAYLPGSDIELRSGAVAVELRCSDRKPPCDFSYDPSTGECYPPPMDCIWGWDPSTGECADTPPPMDCIFGFDPATGTCAEEPPADAPGASSGGCSASGSPVSALPAALPIVFLMVRGRRRR